MIFKHVAMLAVDIMDYQMSEFKFYRKLRKGSWFYVHFKGDPMIRYWTHREPLSNERVMQTEVH